MSLARPLNALAPFCGLIANREQAALALADTHIYREEVILLQSDRRTAAAKRALIDPTARAAAPPHTRGRAQPSRVTDPFSADPIARARALLHGRKKRHSYLDSHVEDSRPLLAMLCHF